MIDNLNAVLPLLTYADADDHFYVLEVIKRRKENPGIKSNSVLVDTFYLYKGDLELRYDRIKEVCNSSNARAYLRLNVRSSKAVACRTMSKVAKLIEDSNYKAVKRAYASAAGEVNSAIHRRWIVDVDTKDEWSLQRVIELVKLYNPILAQIPTVNGFHFVVNPFNRQEFDKTVSFHPLVKNIISSEAICVDSPTLLYYKGLD